MGGGGKDSVCAGYDGDCGRGVNDGERGGGGNDGE